VASRLGSAVPGPTDEAVEWIDPHRLDREPVLDLVHRLADELHTRAGGEFPRWALYDCVQTPGGVVGFAVSARDASPTVREVLRVPEDYTGPVPVSMVAAVPMLDRGAWHLYGLGAIEGSPAPALELAMTVLGIRSAVGTTGWRSPDLEAHTRLGPLEVLTAWTPAHTEPATLTYRFDVDAVVGETGASTTIAFRDVAALRVLQEAIESGDRYRIVGPPVGDGDAAHVVLEALTA
jgi:hypothetical protein